MKTLPTVSPNAVAPNGSSPGAASATVARGAVPPAPSRVPARREPLLRETLGSVLRGLRSESGRTLRDVADTARVSPGYLSELERGRKEASSELLSAVSVALDTTLEEILIRAAGELATRDLAPGGATALAA